MTEPRPGVDPATSGADDMAAMRSRWAEANGRSPDLPSDVAVLCAEVGRLRADLAEAQQRITGVRAIHSPSRPTWNQPVDWCAGCGHDYPCPTIAALSTGGTDRTEGDEQ